MQKTEKQRTISQNRAYHLMCNQVSDLLIGKGIDQRMIMRDLTGYETPVTPEFLKLVFKTIMWTMYRKDSTTMLSSTEMTNCFDVFQKFLGETYQIEVSWPSYDQLAMQALIDSKK